MTELESIDGVGPSYATELASAGYDDAEAVASADPDELAGVLDTMTGEELVSNATDVVDQDEAPKSNDTDGPYTLEPDFDPVQEYQLLYALMNEFVKANRTNNIDRTEAALDALDDVRSGEPYEFTMAQLSIAYTGTNQLESEYRGTRGLSNFVSQMRDVKNVFQAARTENWPEE